MGEYLNAERVEEIFMDCLFRDGEPHDDFVKAEGISTTVCFHPARLESHKNDIRAMLDELPAKFHKHSGGGWSFLNACNDRTGHQWTGMHQRMEQLFQLGIGVGLAQCQVPKGAWSALPGGMPYYMVDV